MDQDQKIQQRVKRALDREQVDDATQSKLAAARSRALDHGGQGGIPRWLPAGAVAAMVLVAAGLIWTLESGDETLPGLNADELAVISSEDELELLEEFEFYAWFGSEEQTQAGS